MATKATLKLDVSAAMMDYLQKELTRSFDEEFEKAVESVRSKKDDMIAKMAIRIARQYDIRQNGETITIAVREIKT